jgi:hypothetical protein
MSCVRAGKDFERSFSQKAMTSQCTFCFEMPESMMLSSMFNETDMKRGFQQLPPSIRIVEARSNKSLITSQSTTPGICDVAYYIDARFFLKGRTVRETTREIIVMPVIETPPPIDPADFRNEYRLLASSTIGISWRRRYPLEISISSSEPRPLNFEASRVKEDLSLTELLITFLARHLSSEGDSNHLAQPEISECHLAITLEATTFFFRNEEHSVLSISETRDTPFSVVKNTRFKPQRLKVCFLNWQRVKNSSSRSHRSTKPFLS